MNNNNNKEYNIKDFKVKEFKNRRAKFINGNLMDLDLSKEEYYSISRNIRRIFITHEHDDHFNPKVMMLAIGDLKKVYMTEYTKDKIIYNLENKSNYKMDPKLKELFLYMINNLVITLEGDKGHVIEGYGDFETGIKWKTIKHGNTKSTIYKIIKIVNGEYFSFVFATDVSSCSENVNIINKLVNKYTDISFIECSEVANFKSSGKHFNIDHYNMINHPNKIKIHTFTYRIGGEDNIEDQIENNKNNK